MEQNKVPKFMLEKSNSIKWKKKLKNTLVIDLETEQVEEKNDKEDLNIKNVKVDVIKAY